MKRLQQYIPPLIALATALLQLACRIIRQVILPTWKRKGNLLSSLFVLFTSLTELLIGFGETVVCIPRKFNKPLIGQKALSHMWAFSQKYLRQGMLIAAWALFILSSLEWTSPRPSIVEQTATEQQAPVHEQTISRQVPADVNACTPASDHIAVLEPVLITRANPFFITPHAPRWLLLRILRI